MGGGSSGIPVVGGLVDTGKNIIKGNATSKDWVNVASMGATGMLDGGLSATGISSVYGMFESAAEQKKAQERLLKEQQAQQAGLEAEAKNRDNQGLAVAAREAARRVQAMSAGSGGRRSTLFSLGGIGGMGGLSGILGAGGVSGAGLGSSGLQSFLGR